jgi:plasmid stabilization system protein ParE
MRGCIVSLAAEEDIESILRWTDEHFGERARVRLYRVRSDGRLEISRVLHDSMDLARHLPPEHQD